MTLEKKNDELNELFAFFFNMDTHEFEEFKQFVEHEKRMKIKTRDSSGENKTKQNKKLYVTFIL